MVRGVFYILVLSALFAISVVAEEPWSRSEKDPTTSDNITAARHTYIEPNLSLKYPFYAFIKFYQKAISPLNGPKCSFHPTCSEYGYQAIKKHGPVLGSIMGTARMLKDHQSEKYPITLKNGKIKNFDPIENNDFWFNP